MPTNTIAQLADAATAELNTAGTGPGGTLSGGVWSGGVWPLAFTAARAWQPIFDLRNLVLPAGVGALVSVVPDSMPLDQRVTRQFEREEHVLYIVVQAKLPDRTNGSVDPLADLLEDIKDFFFKDQHQLTTTTLVARCTEAEIQAYCWRPHLEEYSAYTGVAALTFTVVE